MVFLSSRISPFTSTVILRRQIAAGHRRGHFGDVTHLTGQVRRHRVDGVGQDLSTYRATPGTMRLAAQLAFGAHLARHARHFEAKERSWSTIVLMAVLQLAEFHRARPP